MTAPHITLAVDSDLNDLVALEQACFSGDRLSRRSFARAVKSPTNVLLVAKSPAGELLGYGLAFLNKGTRLARLYSLAVSVDARGMRLGEKLLETLETVVGDKGWLYMRLEVSKSNGAAIRLYQRMGYRIFGEYTDYYEDHSDALRMQKTIRRMGQGGFALSVPWYRQTTDFTCGPASLMMAMASQDLAYDLTQAEELDLWREATTIYMTSGHGGTHPLGLALAASRRGYSVNTWINRTGTLFVDGVRSDHKKQILEVVEDRFRQQAKERGLQVNTEDFTQDQIENWMIEGYSVLVLISSYRLDGKKGPHWVCITGIDDQCLYVHDPDMSETIQQPIDMQHIPICRSDFARMSAFGSDRLRTAIALKKDTP